MARNWVTKYADQLEGGVNTEKAMFDIQRGVMQNLFHECWGLYGTAVPKNVSGLSWTKTGVVAFDRVKFLPWKDYSKIAKGEDVIEPHIGNVDTVQWTIDKKWSNSTEWPETDLARLKNEPLFRAQYVSSIARTLAASFDGELFDLLIAAAMGKKGAVIEMDFPKRFDPQKVDIYLKVADIVSEIEKILSEYYMGVPRKQVLVIVDPKLFSRVIRGLLGTQILMEKALDFIQNEQITPTVISGISITRHIALDNVIIGQASNKFKSYNFKGIRAIMDTIFRWEDFLFDLYLHNGFVTVCSDILVILN